MTYQGRSLDDLPLAAYTTGVDPDLTEEPEPPEEPHLSQQEAVALALGLEPAAPAAPVEEAKAEKRRPGLPRPRLPKLPKPGRKAKVAVDGPAANVLDDSPSWPVAASVPAPSPTYASAYAPTAAPMSPVAAAPAAASYAPMPAEPAAASYNPMPAAPAPRPARAAAMPAASAARPQMSAPTFVKAGSAGAIAVAAPGVRARPWAALDLTGLLRKLRNPRAAARDPKVLVGAAVLVGGAFLIWNLAGGGSGAGGPAAGASPTPGAPVTVAPGAASVTVTGSVSGSYELVGSTGFGRPADAHLDSSWTDALGTSLSIVGQATAGTRTTGDDLVLTWTVLINASPVTFTSSAGECTIGMATKPAYVTGSFVCPKLTSADGLIVVKVNGTYQT